MYSSSYMYQYLCSKIYDIIFLFSLICVIESSQDLLVARLQMYKRVEYKTIAKAKTKSDKARIFADKI